MSSTALRAPVQSASETAIPVIDLGPYLAGAPGALEATCRAAARAPSRTIGFFIIVNHDVPQDLIARTFAEARRFHDAADGRQDGAAHERAQQRLHGDGPLRGLDLGRQRQRQARPERGLFHQARAAGRTIRCAAVGPALRRAESLAGRAARLSRDRPGLHRRGRRPRAPPAARRARWRSICRPTHSTPRSPRASSRSACRTIRRSRRRRTSSASRRTPTPTS